MSGNKIVFASAILLLIFCSGCGKFMELPLPENVSPAEIIFSNDSSAREAMAGLYYKIMNTQSLLNGSISIYAGLSADELKCNSTKADEVQFYNNALSSQNGAVLTYLWKSGYYDIHFANTCIEKLAESSGVSEVIKKQYTGEAKLIRGLCYWYLVNLFGDIPLTTSAKVSEKMFLNRAPAYWVFLQIQDDLKHAMSLLPMENSNTIPGKYAAITLLARTACYLKEWVKAENYATSVITAGRFALVSDINKVFSSESSEIIFQLPSASTGFSTFEGFSFIPASGSSLPAFSLSNSLMNSFEANDQRKSNWVKSALVNGQLYYYPFKCKIRKTPSQLENNVILRLAELYLIRAEARARLGNISGAVADLNILRNRAGLDSISSGIALHEFLKQIDQERKLEFFAEWGHRWFDLKRNKQIDDTLKVNKGTNWQPTDKLYPIPHSEMQTNPKLIQNEGYE
jgi:starch-binding outer membrane protein, SusD/RagB family